MSTNVTWKNEKRELLLHFSLIVNIFECLPYFKIASNVGSLTLSETGSLESNLGMP